MALTLHACFFLCEIEIRTQGVVVTQNDACKLPGTVSAMKGVCSINVNCYLILTGPQQGRAGVVSIL